MNKQKMDIDQQFSDIVREQMTDKEFWAWAITWLDADNVCDMAEDWEEQSKVEFVKEWNKKHKEPIIK